MRGLRHELVRLHDASARRGRRSSSRSPRCAGWSRASSRRARVGSWSSTWLQCTVTASPGFQMRTAEPTRSTTPAASLPTTWNGWSWRAPHTLSRPSRCRNPNVGQRLEDRRPHGVEVDRRRHHRDERLVGRELGQRDLVDVHRLPRVLLLRRARPANISCSSARTTAARNDVREREGGELVAGRSVDDRGADRARSRRHGGRTVADPPRTRDTIGSRPLLSPLGGPPCPVPSSSRPPAPHRQALRRARRRSRPPTSAVTRSPPRSPGRGSAGDQVDYVLIGQVLQAGAGQMPARQAAVKGGIPMTVPSMTRQQGVPLGHQRDLPRRPDDPGRRRRGRRRRRHGVDDQGARTSCRRRARATAWATASCSTR